jgi:hypothetical protein
MCSMSAFSSSSRPSRYARRGGQRLVLIACAALLAAASLCAKAVNYPAEKNAHSEQDEQPRVQEFLTDHRWVLSESAEFVPGVGGAVLNFQVPGCIGIVRVGLLPPNGEMVSLFARTAGRDVRVFYVYRGRITADPPPFAYFQTKVIDLMRALGFRPRASSAVVAVSQPEECRLEAVLPWSEL